MEGVTIGKVWKLELVEVASTCFFGDEPSLASLGVDLDLERFVCVPVATVRSRLEVALKSGEKTLLFTALRCPLYEPW